MIKKCLKTEIQWSFSAALDEKINDTLSDVSRPVKPHIGGNK